MAAGKLTARQKAFVEAFSKCLNATQAAIAAGYKEHSARKTGSKLRTNADINAAIAELVEMPPVEVVAGVSEIARGDIGEYIKATDDGIRIDLENKNTKLIRRISQSTTRHVSARGGETFTTRLEIEMYSRADALNKLGEYHGLWKQRVAHENPDGTAIEPVNPIVIYIPDNGRPRTHQTTNE